MRKPVIMYCKKCNDSMPAIRHAPNHILHIFLSIVTGGLWLFVYAVVAVETTGKGTRCQKCQSRV